MSQSLHNRNWTGNNWLICRAAKCQHVSSYHVTFRFILCGPGWLQWSNRFQHCPTYCQCTSSSRWFYSARILHYTTSAIHSLCQNFQAEGMYFGHTLYTKRSCTNHNITVDAWGCQKACWILSWPSGRWLSRRCQELVQNHRQTIREYDSFIRSNCQSILPRRSKD